MTIEITYDRDARCFVGYEPQRGLYSAGRTWQRGIRETVSAVEMSDRYVAALSARPAAQCRIGWIALGPGEEP